MMRRNRFVIAVVFLAVLVFAGGSLSKEKGEVVGISKYEDLTSLFKEWRELQKPKIINGVPDYTPAAMKEQKRDLEKMKSRLVAVNYETWPISQQVDFHLVRAEMNGLEFDHRVLRPWSRNPCFYWVVAGGELDKFQEGPDTYGLLVIPKLPLTDKDITWLRMKLQAIPKILEQAKKNLTEEAKDLWYLGILDKKKESAILTDLAKNLSRHHPDLAPDAERAKTAVDEFRAWLEEKHSKMTAPSGIGIQNYNWYMKNVHLVPYTWEEQMAILQRELQRAWAYLKLEENKNRDVPQLERAPSKEVYQKRFQQACDYIMEFYRKEGIFTVPDYVHLDPNPGGGWSFIPPEETLDFFTNIEYRDSLPMRCHDHHTIDDLREEHDQRYRPIRGNVLLSNIWAFRAEGLATGNEEMMMHAGLFDKRSPRVRELIYTLLANRAARAIGGMKMHSNEFTLEDAVKFAIEWTPRGWLPKDQDTVWFDEKLYLHQPGYGASYVIGKIQLDKLLADRAHQLGDKFSIKQCLDEFFSSGMIPIALTRWEMTGLEDEIKKLW
jgi:hypothetical protein